MGSRKTHDGAEAVYEAAKKWVDHALRKDDSLFTPGVPIWSSRWLGELRRQFLDRPDVGQGDFYDKLSAQLADSPPEVYQLMGEVLYVQLLIIGQGGMAGETKMDQIERVLGWGAPVRTIPEYLTDALTSGIVATQAFTMYRPYQVGFLIEFAEQWKERQHSAERERLLGDPWAFKRLVMRRTLRSVLLRNNQTTPSSQRNALLHLVYPDTFEAIVSVAHKRLIGGSAAFEDFATEGTTDVDRRIQQIRRGLEARLGREVDFYEPDMRTQWEREAARWDAFVERAQMYCRTGRLERDEIPYKLTIGEKVDEARIAVLAGSDNWPRLVKAGIAGNIVFNIQQSRFRQWIDESPQKALTALRELWKPGHEPVTDRIRDFCRLFPARETRISGNGTRLNLISQLLMGLAVEQYPPFRKRKFDDACDRAGYEGPRRGADESTLYEHALGFLDRFIEEADKRGLALENRLAAQSVLWGVMGDYWENDEIDLHGTDDTGQIEPDSQAIADSLYLPAGFLEEIEALLEDKKQVIFQGPPGTGKTYVAQALAKHLAGSDERVTLVQLHPSYAYEDFVQGFRPTLTDSGQPGFELRDGPLLRAAKRAREDEDSKHFLILDEINRGNLAKVLGELYFLLEYRDKKISLQYSDKPFELPRNLYFIGTMNTADRSIALVDLALRRRFNFKNFHPDDEPVRGVLRRWIEEKAHGMEWVADVVELANDRPELRADRHAAIGPSYFIKPGGLTDEVVERVWKHNVLPYIEERLFVDREGLDAFGLDRLRGEAERAAAQNAEARENREAAQPEAGSEGESDTGSVQP